MNACPDESTLLDVANGDADAWSRAHVARCRDCTTRLTALRTDLAMLRGVLADDPLPAGMRRTAPRAAWSDAWAWSRPLATVGVAAVALLAVSLWSRTTPIASTTSQPQLASLAGDFSAALFSSRESVSYPDTLSDHEYVAAALNGGWPCDAGSAYGGACDYADLLDQ
jgi:hypothetical protein